MPFFFCKNHFLYKNFEAEKDQLLKNEPMDEIWVKTIFYYFILFLWSRITNAGL